MKSTVKQHADRELGRQGVVLVIAEFPLFQRSQGVWDGQHRLWAAPTASCKRSPSRALVLASTSQPAVMLALRWRCGGDTFDAVLSLRSTCDRFFGRLCGTHPQLPASTMLRGDAAGRYGICLWGDEDGRPWEVTLGHSGQEIALTVSDGANDQPELPVMHASYPTLRESLQLGTATRREGQLLPSDYNPAHGRLQ